MSIQRFIVSFGVLFTVLSLAAYNIHLVGKSHRLVGHYDVDSTTTNAPARPTAEGLDSTVAIPLDSLTNVLDSIKSNFDREHGIKPENKSNAIQWNDSIAAVEDSIRKTKKKSALEAPVVYEAKDSMTVFMES